MDAMKTCPAVTAEVRQFCESVSESTTKNIRLLKAIEQTVDWLAWLQKRAKADTEFAQRTGDHLKTCERVKPIDVDGTLGTLFEEVESGLKGLHQILVRKLDAARTAPELERDHKLDVVDEYSAAINAASDLHNVMSDLHWAIGEHDAYFSPRAEGLVFSSSKDIENYLESL
jgi:hypothetical protein